MRRAGREGRSTVDGLHGGEHAGVTVYWAGSEPVPGLGRLLSDEERQQAARYRHGRRSAFVTAHGLLRILLSRRIGLPPSELRLVRRCESCGGSHGKPELVDQGDPRSADPVRFNLSYAGGIVVIALVEGGGRTVGVDVEVLPRSKAPLTTFAPDAILSPSERHAFEQISGPERAHALAVWWVRKEAFLKATGYGLTVDPSHLEVTAPQQAAALVTWPPPPPSALGPGTGGPARHVEKAALRDLAAPAGHVAAIAVVGADALSIRSDRGEPLLEAAARASLPPPGSPRNVGR